MTVEEDLKQVKGLLAKFTLSSNCPEENRLDIMIERTSLKPAVTAILIDGHWGYLPAITALDQPVYDVDETTNEKKLVLDQGNVEVLYHFCRGAAIATLRVSAPYADPNLDSICDILSSASLYEREAMELLGVNFIGTPNTDRLILPESWPEGVYPLRKSFTGLQKTESPVEGERS
jgi:Ni,Fe-hydrogenase III component G